MEGQAYHRASAVGLGRSQCRDKSGLCQVNASFSSVDEPQCDENAPQSLGTLDISSPISKIDLNLRKSGAQIFVCDSLNSARVLRASTRPHTRRGATKCTTNSIWLLILISNQSCHLLLHSCKVLSPSLRCCCSFGMGQPPRPDSCTCIAIHSHRLPLLIRTFFLNITPYMLILKRCNGMLHRDRASNRSDHHATGFPIGAPRLQSVCPYLKPTSPGMSTIAPQGDSPITQFQFHIHEFRLHDGGHRTLLESG